MRYRSYLLTILTSVFIAGPLQTSADTIDAVNHVETYKAQWWGADGAIRTRPDFHVARIDNGKLELWYTIIPGRPMEKFILPYWPIRSFLSILDRPAEMTHVSRTVFTMDGETEEIGFLPRSGIELAELNQADVLKIRNRSIASPEDITKDEQEPNPLMMEHLFLVPKDKRVIEILVRITNTGDKILKNVVSEIHYEQDFNWSDFGAAKGAEYRDIESPAQGDADAFYAFSCGMGRGYEFISLSSCTLAYTLLPEKNEWKVSIGCPAVDLAPGESSVFRYAIRVLRNTPSQITDFQQSDQQLLLDLPFKRHSASSYKSPPLITDGRVMLPEVIASLESQKTRGIDLRDEYPTALNSLETLKDWGCNLVIIEPGEPNETARIIEKAHSLDMEAFLVGRGRYREGSPEFDTFYGQSLTPAQFPDSHGQDEDHYYWFSMEPSCDFEANFHKPMAEATLDEKVLYWADCYIDKWEGVRSQLRQYTPTMDIWFYKPAPSIAHVEPLEYYSLFLRRLTRLGETLTVLPFYYGIEYDQAEYMVRMWKDAGAPRVVFLPMIDFMVKPSQFIRAITAARRGQADGMCGFNFKVLDESPDRTWQWKSILLAALANFPSPEMDAFCFIEEPAELVEKLAVSDVIVISNAQETEQFVSTLEDFLPGTVRVGRSVPESQTEDSLIVAIGGPKILDRGNWAYDVPQKYRHGSKGLLQMRDNAVCISGTDQAGVKNAIQLFLRFVQLVPQETKGGSGTSIH